MLLIATPVQFVAQTLLADEFSASVMTAIVAVAVAFLVTIMTGLPKVEELRALSVSDTTLAIIAGLLGIFGTQYLVLSHRFTDAPPGSEVIFFTTAVWGGLAVLAGYATRRKPTGVQVIAAGVALVGAAAVLANWERPSSFSPLVRYPAEDIAMVIAGAAWAAFGVLMARLAQRHRWRVILPIAGASAALVAVVLAVLSPGNVGAFQRISALWPLLLVLCATFTAMVVSWAWLSPLVGIARSASLLFLAPVSLTVLGVFERRVGAAGPSPLLWEAVLWGSIVTLVGALGVAALDRTWTQTAQSDPGLARASSSKWQRRLAVAILMIAALATLAGAVALAAPALHARVAGTRIGGSAYEASWSLLGAETAAAWLVFLGALALALAGSANLRLLWRAAASIGVAAGVLIVLSAVPALDHAPLRTWTRWIPAEVQQDYGTEYASLTFADEPRNALTTGMALGLTGAMILLAAGAAAAAGTRGSGAASERSARLGPGAPGDTKTVETIE